MFVHAGFKAFWPVIFLLPWLFLGIAYLTESALHRHHRGADANQHSNRKTVSAAQTSAHGEPPAC